MSDIETKAGKELYDYVILGFNHTFENLIYQHILKIEKEMRERITNESNHIHNAQLRPMQSDQENV